MKKFSIVKTTNQFLLRNAGKHEFKTKNREFFLANL